jgi:predicted O-methyltransferase YrrM
MEGLHNMPNDQWSKVDDYITDVLVKPDAALDRALETSHAAGLPAIAVAPGYGKLLHVLARLVNARAILEIGTLGGYSAIWMARALQPGGRLISLEFDPKHAELARANLANAGVDRLVDVRIGPALEALPKIAVEGIAPFDLIFIDADKPNTAEYFRWALRLARVGSLIVVDNVVRNGEVANAATTDTAVQGMRRFMEIAAAERRVIATALQTVGSKGYDGFSIALVTS